MKQGGYICSPLKCGCVKFSLSKKEGAPALKKTISRDFGVFRAKRPRRNKVILGRIESAPNQPRVSAPRVLRCYIRLFWNLWADGLMCCNIFRFEKIVGSKNIQNFVFFDCISPYQPRLVFVACHKVILAGLIAGLIRG